MRGSAGRNALPDSLEGRLFHLRVQVRRQYHGGAFCMVQHRLRPERLPAGCQYHGADQALRQCRIGAGHPLQDPQREFQTGRTGDYGYKLKPPPEKMRDFS